MRNYLGRRTRSRFRWPSILETSRIVDVSESASGSMADITLLEWSRLCGLYFGLWRVKYWILLPND